MVVQASRDPEGWIEITDRAARALREDLAARGKSAVRLMLRGFD